jgi:hypothetical protein
LLPHHDVRLAVRNKRRAALQGGAFFNQCGGWLVIQVLGPASPSLNGYDQIGRTDFAIKLDPLKPVDDVGDEGAAVIVRFGTPIA